MLNFEYIRKHSDTVHLLPDIYLPDHLKRPADFFVFASMYPQTLQSVLMLLARQSSCRYILHTHLSLPLLLQNFSLRSLSSVHQDLTVHLQSFSDFSLLHILPFQHLQDLLISPSSFFVLLMLLKAVGRLLLTALSAAHFY